jgi:hypothetical protein
MFNKILVLVASIFLPFTLNSNLLHDLNYEFYLTASALQAHNMAEYTARMEFISEQLKEFSLDEQKEILSYYMQDVVEKYNFNQNFSPEQSVNFARNILEFLQATEQEFPATDNLKSKDDYALESFTKIAHNIAPLVKNSARSQDEFNEQLTCFFLEHMTNAVCSYTHLEEALSTSPLNDLYVRAIIDLCRLNHALEHKDNRMLYFTCVSARWYFELSLQLDVIVEIGLQKQA